MGRIQLESCLISSIYLEFTSRSICPYRQKMCYCVPIAPSLKSTSSIHMNEIFIRNIAPSFLQICSTICRLFSVLKFSFAIQINIISTVDPLHQLVLVYLISIYHTSFTYTAITSPRQSLHQAPALDQHIHEFKKYTETTQQAKWLLH